MGGGEGLGTYQRDTLCATESEEKTYTMAGIIFVQELGIKN